MSQPLLLGQVVRYFQNNKDNPIDFNTAALSAAGVVGCSAVFVTFNHLNICYVMKFGMRMRVACCALMYKKVCFTVLFTKYYILYKI